MMINAEKSILQCKNIKALENHIPLYHYYTDCLLLFYVEEKNFENLFDIDIDEQMMNVGIELTTVIHPDDIELFCIFNSENISPKNFQLHFRILKQNGQIIILLGEFDRVLNHDLKHADIFTAKLIDVRDLSKNTDEQNVTKINFQAMMEHTDDFIFFKDAHHVLTASSDSMARITGHNKGYEIVGKIDYELFPKEHAEVYYKLEKEIYKGKLSQIEEVQPFKDENGEEGWIDNRKYPIKDSSGKIIGLFGIARVITQNVKNQKKMQEQKEELEKAQHIAHLGSWTYDVLSDKLIWSDEVYNIFEIDKNITELSYGFFLKTLYPDDKKIVDEAYLLSIKNKTPYNIVHRLLFDNKRVKYVHERAEHKFSENGDTIYTFGTVQDITNLKEYENKLKEKDEMIIAQSRLAAMGEMISMIAHQWRQPLAVISMDANNLLLDIELETMCEEEVKKRAYGILDQSQYLSHTIDDFRNFFKSEKQKEEKSISTVVNDAFNIILKSLESHEIVCKLTSATDEKIMIFPRELAQVFISILNNAKDALVEYREKDRAIHITIEDINGEIVTKICNNGGEVETENLNKIFEPYFSTKYEKNGTGIGLYMSKMIIEQHMNGRLSAENIDGGVCFSIALAKQ